MRGQIVILVTFLICSPTSDHRHVEFDLSNQSMSLTLVMTDKLCNIVIKVDHLCPSLL